MKSLIVLTIIGSIIGLSAACSTATAPTANTTAATNRAATETTTAANSGAASSSNGGSATNDAAANNREHKSDEDAPATVKAVFPDAQSFVKQHKDIAPSAISNIEKETGAKVPDTDHHSYLAFTTTGGARRQIGAATVVKAEGRDVVIVYDSKNGMPTIREVRAETVPAGFLAQFAGKGHDDKFQIGADLKANGANEATARAIASAVKVDAMTMQTLYGAAHSH